MSKRKLSSLSFSEKTYSGLRFSASVSNLQCSSPVFNIIDSPSLYLHGNSNTSSPSAFKTLFRLKKSKSSRSIHKRNTFCSIWDLRSCTNYKVTSPHHHNINNELFGEATNGRQKNKKLINIRSLRQLNSFDCHEDNTSFKRLRLLWRHARHKSISEKMLDDRKLKIIMPWGHASLDIVVEHKNLTCDVVDMVASKCKLVERSYFGLAFRDATTNQLNWLQPDKRVLDYDLPKSGGMPILHFAVRYFMDAFTRLQTTTSIELLYLQSKEQIFKGDLECSDEDVFKLAALVLQETCGDYTDEESTRKVISKYPLLPSFLLQKHPSITFCENRILEYYKSLTRNTRGLVIVGFLSIVESLPSYGTHYYCVKDKEGIPWWLGISRRGVAVYDFNDRTRPRRLFKWETIENIFYRDKKFCLEVYTSRKVTNKADGSNVYEDVMRDFSDLPDDLHMAISDPTTQVSISKRVYSPSTVDVHHWVCATAQLTELIWSMAVSQHKFSVEVSLGSPGGLRSTDEIVRELNISTPLFSEPGWTDHSQPATDLALETKKILSTTGNDAEVLEKARQQLKILKDKKFVLNDNLTNKLRELKRICLEEANLIGELPKEYPLEAGESVPKVKKRVGTSYSFCPNVINNSGKGSNEISQEVVDYEIQDKITKAALVLAQEEKIPKNIRKNRIEAYHKEWKKLKAMECSLKHSSRNKKSRDESNKKLRSMREPRVLPTVATEAKTRRSLEALPTVTPHNPEDHLRGRLKSLKLDHFNSTRYLSQLSRTPSIPRSRSHRSAPSSPTLPRCPQHSAHLPQHNHPHFKHKVVYHDIGLGRQTLNSCTSDSLPYEYQRLPSDFNRHQLTLQHNNPHSFNNHQIFPSTVVHHHHAHIGCPSTSFVVPLSADPRITSRNFAAGYGLLTCETGIPMAFAKNWEHYDSSSQGSGFSSKYPSQVCSSRGVDRTIGHNFLRMHLSDNLNRYKSESSSTLSSSSGGASGSTSSCNKLFSKSSAYPTPTQIGSVFHGDLVSSSDASMSSFANYDQQITQDSSYNCFSYGRRNEDKVQTKKDSYEGKLERAPSSHDSGYEASSQGVSSNSGFSSHMFNLSNVSYKRDSSKPYELSDISKYSEALRAANQSQDYQRFRANPNLTSCGSFSSNSSSMSRGSVSSTSSLYGYNSRPSFFVRSSNLDVRKDVTLTRENAEDFCQDSENEAIYRTSMLLNSSSSRSRKPILCGSDVSMDMLIHASNGREDGRQRLSDSSDTGSSKDGGFNSFPFEMKVSQEFETEMLQWYEMCGVSPQPDDKFTLV